MTAHSADRCSVSLYKSPNSDTPPTYLCPSQPYRSQLFLCEISIFLKLQKQSRGWKRNPVRVGDLSSGPFSVSVQMENAALSSPHALNSTLTCAFFWLLRTSPLLSLRHEKKKKKDNDSNSNFSRLLPRLEQHAQLITNATAPSQLTSAVQRG